MWSPDIKDKKTSLLYKDDINLVHGSLCKKDLGLTA